MIFNLGYASCLYPDRDIEINCLDDLARLEEDANRLIKKHYDEARYAPLLVSFKHKDILVADLDRLD